MDPLVISRNALSRYIPKTLPREGLVESSVILPLQQSDEGLSILFTRRTSTVRHHKNQISFPGGVREARDRDLRETALRETREEIGIAGDDIEIIGELDDITTVTGYRISPFVAVIPNHCRLAVNAGEIQELLAIPLARLMDKAIFSTGARSYKGARFTSYFFKVGDNRVIWGATALILVNFLQIALAWRIPEKLPQPLQDYARDYPST
jgi:8-oxo-dGTP pyrophosphatase MutT (NUDIX family)